jgi:hypothetical protein
MAVVVAVAVAVAMRLPGVGATCTAVVAKVVMCPGLGWMAAVSLWQVG